jgi:phage terminase small subunit
MARPLSIVPNTRATAPVREHVAKAIESGDPKAVFDCLTGKQQKFVEEYLECLNASLAVKKAGYKTDNPGKVAHDMMKNPGVRFAIDGLKAIRAKNSDITSDYVLKEINEIVKEARKENQLGHALRGLELLGKHLSMFVDRTEISGPDGEAIKYEEKIKNDVATFTSSIARLATRNGEVVEAS